MNNRLSNMDAVEFLKSLESGSADLMVTDPAYESLEKHRRVGTTTRLKKQWFDIFPNSRYEEFFEEAYRVLKNNSHFYMMCDQETLHVVKPIGEKVGFKYWKFLVWNKMKIGMGYHYRAQHELILFFEKGKRKLNNLGIPDVISVPRIKSKDAYPTEKPINLYSTLIGQSTTYGEVVCDPFCGAGTAGEAAVLLGNKFLLNDNSQHAVELTKKRLSDIRIEGI